MTQRTTLAAGASVDGSSLFLDVDRLRQPAKVSTRPIKHLPGQVDRADHPSHENLPSWENERSRGDQGMGRGEERQESWRSVEILPSWRGPAW